MSTAAPATPSAPKYSKLLIASLALNLLILGLIGGAVFSHRFGRPHEFHLGDPGFRGFMRSLPKDRRELLRSAGEQGRQTWRPLRQAVQQARAEVDLAMSAVPFDASRAEKSLNELIAAEATARRAGTAVLLSAVSKMTPEERVSFQKWRRKHQRRNGPPDHNDGGEIQPPPPLPAPAPVSVPK